MTYFDRVQEDPDSRYTLDSERDAPQSELCRQGDKLSKKCIMVRCAVCLCGLNDSNRPDLADSNALYAVIPGHAGESSSLRAYVDVV